MIAGFDLLKGPYRHLISSSVNVQILIDQSTNLAKNLIFAFKTPTGIPANNLQLANSTFNMSEPNGLATIGSLVLEWTRLSDITGLPEFANLTQHAEQYLLDPQPASSEPWPGLLGTNVDIRTGQFLDSNGGWGGGDDSFYEYLIKMYVYDPLRFSAYKDRWILAADSSMTHLASHPSTRPDLTFLAGFNGKNLKLQSSHLACFDGGNFILGGLVLGEQRYIDFGLSLVDSCEDTYAQTATRIGPETWKWSETVDGGKGDTFYNRAGFDIVVGTYNLRPEVLESFYYAYRATGNTKYQDWAWNAFVAVNATCRVGSGFSAISNVSRSDGGYKNNFQESYLFAEFFKYAYLIQSASARVQVMGGAIQEWVLNTEGHPFRVVGV
jgi:mannosyl-oligosaccharide alpha-1,2-mannosidase